MEYLLVHGGSRGHHLHYELLYDGASNENDDAKRLCGLIDPSELDNIPAYDSRKLGEGERNLPPSWGQNAPILGSTWSEKNQAQQGLQADLPEISKKPHIKGNGKSPPFVAVV